MSNWIEFREIPTPANWKTKRWEIITREGNQRLGIVAWFGRWRKYAFFPDALTVYQATCRHDIQTFLDSLMAEGKTQSAKRHEQSA